MSAARILIFRKRDPHEGEVVAEFAFSDLARLAAGALCERYHWPTEVHYTDESFGIDRFEWGTVERDGVKLVTEYGRPADRHVQVSAT